MPIPPPEHATRAFHGKILDLWQWEQSMYDGTTETFECVIRPDTAAVIAFLDPKTVLLTRQEQPHRTPFIDVPGGRIDTGEDPATGAIRELQEETGYQAGRHLLWGRYPSTGINRYESFIFLATDLTDGHGTHHDSGERIETMTVSWEELVEHCLTRELRQPNVMLEILRMASDPESKARLQGWLNSR